MGTRGKKGFTGQGGQGPAVAAGQRPRRAMTRRAAGGGSLLLVLLASTASYAQCVSSVGPGLQEFGGTVIPGGAGREFTPQQLAENIAGTTALAGSGAAAINALTSVFSTANTIFLTQ